MPAQAPAPTPAPEPKKKRTHLFVLIVVAIGAIAAIAASVFVLMNPAGIQTDATEATGEIVITEYGVSPSTITVKKGDSVLWRNQDTAAHSIILTSPNPPAELEGFGSDEPLDKGETYSFLFEATGTFTYEDPQNPARVQGTITVEDK